MKDYFLRDGGKLKKLGIKKRVRSERYKLLMKNTVFVELDLASEINELNIN